MVRVVVFVSGIALARLTGGVDEPAVVLMASGYHHYSEITRHEPHATQIVQGLNRVVVPIYGRPVIEFKAPCASGTCPAIPEPGKTPNLTEVIAESAMRKACIAPATLKECTTNGTELGQPLYNLYLRFTGPWKVTSMIDCYGGYPEQRDALPHYNYLKPKDSLTVRFDEAREYGNSMVFYADVEPDDVQRLMKIESEYIKLDAFDLQAGNGLCQRLAGLGGSTSCVVVAIRNRANNPVLSKGGPDPHFAPLFTLLQAPPSYEDLWLPFSVAGEACPKTSGGGCCGLAGCSSGYVTK